LHGWLRVGFHFDAIGVYRAWFAVTKGRYTFSVERPELSDLTNISFDEFVWLIFERAMPPEAEEVNLSFHYVEVELDAKKILYPLRAIVPGPGISAFALHEAAG